MTEMDELYRLNDAVTRHFAADRPAEMNDEDWDEFLNETTHQLANLLEDRLHELKKEGHWSTSDEHGNIDGPYDTKAEAIAHGAGQFVFWVEDEEDEHE